MDLETAIRTRRTHKVFGPEPVDRATLDELMELARWAPNHNLTNPWRMRVVGPQALDAMKEAAGPEGAAKLDRAPTMIAVSALQGADPVQNEEDRASAACAAYILLLGAHARGLAGYWRTPGFLRTREGSASLGIGEDEHFVGLIHLGAQRQDKPVPQRSPSDEYVSYLP